MTPALSIITKDEIRACLLDGFLLTFEVEEVTFSSTDRLTLTDDDSGHNLLSKLGLSLLDTSKEHVSDGTSGEAVESGTNSSASDHV